MRYAFLFCLLGSLLIVMGGVEEGLAIPMMWLGCDLLILGMAHARGAAQVFGKRADGTLPWWSLILFLPLLVYTWLVWQILRLISREPARNTVTDRLEVGRRLLESEMEGGFENFVDLTSEFIEPTAIRKLPGYRCFPVLDGAAPDPEKLFHFLNALRPGRTFVHCAQGHGRTGMFALAWLLREGEARTVEEGLRKLRQARPGIRLNGAQMKCVQACARELVRNQPRGG